MKSGEIENQVMLKYSYLLTNILSQNFQRAHGAMNFHLPVPSLPARIEIFNNEVRNKNGQMLIERAVAAKFSAGSTFAYLTIRFHVFFFCLNLKRNMTENTEE